MAALTEQIAELIEGALVNEGILSPADLRAIDPQDMLAVAVAVEQLLAPLLPPPPA
jgi:hypothetical protein